MEKQSLDFKTVLRGILASALLVVAFLPCLALDATYLPEFHGVIRARYEADLDEQTSRFQVRNARVVMQGNVSPAFSYYLRSDFCDRGKYLLLDAFGAFNFAPGWKLTMGVTRMPFGVDCYRGAEVTLFGNRSFIAKREGNFVGAGAKILYQFPKIPLSIETGVFNPTMADDQMKWHKEMAFPTRAIYQWDKVQFAGGFQSMYPDSVRINIWDAAVTWQAGRWTVEGEYIHKHYTNHAYHGAHAYNFWANYKLPVKAGIFNFMSFQGRFDGETDTSNGQRNAEGCLYTTDHACTRLTAGITLTHVYKICHADLRLNYEKYFYQHDYTTTEPDNRILLEMVVRF